MPHLFLFFITLSQDMGPASMPSVPLMVGCGVSCTALLILLLIYAAFWRYSHPHIHIHMYVYMPISVATHPLGRQHTGGFITVWAPIKIGVVIGFG